MGDSSNGPAIIFDLDGTLADTLDDVTASINAALSRVGAEPRSRGQIAGMIGDGAIKLTQRALGSKHAHRLRETLDQFADHYREHALDRTRLFDGIAEQLTCLQRGGWRFAVLSNKPLEFATQCADALLARWPFDAVRGATPDAPPKPDPTTALSIARQWSRPANEIYFAGDSAVDMRTAHNAGMIPVACLWGYGDRENLLGAKPALIADTPSLLAKLLLNHATRGHTPHQT